MRSVVYHQQLRDYRHTIPTLDSNKTIHIDSLIDESFILSLFLDNEGIKLFTANKDIHQEVTYTLEILSSYASDPQIESAEVNNENFIPYSSNQGSYSRAIPAKFTIPHTHFPDTSTIKPSPGAELWHAFTVTRLTTQELLGQSESLADLCKA